MVATRCAEHGLLSAVADPHSGGVASATGYRTTRRLLEDLWHINPDRRLVAHATPLVPGASFSGEPLAPVLPAAARVYQEGLVEDDHVRVIATTMERLARVPDVAPERCADAEAMLAESAATRVPAGLKRVAQRLVNPCDPDGTAPPADARGAPRSSTSSATFPRRTT